ncbi:MAG: HD domain-containing protein [Eubacterium sp.]|nr:HD domain-containing protein [Eubacterium sp.]
MELPVNAKKLIATLTAAGYDAYAVGGFVRDSIMGCEAGDIDITTSATPQEVEAVLADNGIKFVETGIKHGTVTAVIERESYEITTFRTDGDYLDNRHPENVQFVRNLKDDLARRDFTVNALAYNDEVGIVDEFGGVEDINNKIIRAVGDPDRRFKEDALRIMRALRFAAVLGFDIEEHTSQAVFDNKDLLKNIATERIYTELVKLLLGDYCEDILLKYRDVFAVVLPELAPCFDFEQHSKWHLYDVYTHIVKSVALTPKKDYMRLAMLFHDIGKPFVKTTDDNGQDHFKGHPIISEQKARVILDRLHASNGIKHKVQTLIANHDYYITPKPSNIKRWLRNLGEDLTLDYIDFKIADLMSHNLDLSMPEIDTLKRIKLQTIEIINSGEPYRISDLAIGGNELKQIGFEGKQIADELDKLISDVSGNPTLNQKEKLLHIAEADYKPIRKRNRLKNYDYSSNGAYFITICTKEKAKFLSSVVGGGVPDAPKINLSYYGTIIDNQIIEMNNVYENIVAEKYVIMPNHIHILLNIVTGSSGTPTPTNSLVSMWVSTFKRFTNKRCNTSIWQRSFHDHIIRDEDDYLLHLQYIDENPKKWLIGEDEYYS